MLFRSIPDTGERYLSKVYDDDWLRTNGLLESSLHLTAGEILDRRGTRRQPLIHLSPNDSLRAAVERMQSGEISQIPVFEENQPVGSIRESMVLEKMLSGAEHLDCEIGTVMEEPFPVVGEGASADSIFAQLASKPSAAVLVDTPEGFRIITKYDMIHSMSGRRS